MISQLPIISFSYPSKTGKCVYLPSGDVDIDDSFLFKIVLLQEQYNGRLQTGSEEEPCPSQIACVEDAEACILDVFQFGLI